MVDEQGGDRKRRRTDDAKTTHVLTSIHSLPRELVLNILVRVAAHSLNDFFNAKLR